MSKGILIYCKCENCGDYFEVLKRRKFCDSSCRKRDYYKRFGRLKYLAGIKITKIEIK